VPVLPRTGSDTAEWLLLGLLLVAAGALCLAVSRSGRTHL
jgi:LPXTG-motif cell wall-anchored protein